MDFRLWLLISLFYLLVFYLIIKTAVAKGIDDSKSIRELKKEIKELKKHINSAEGNREEVNHIINRKV